MKIRKCTRSILARLEALEAKSPGSLVFEVPSEDGGTKRVSFQELMKMREEPVRKTGSVIQAFRNGGSWKGKI